MSFYKDLPKVRTETIKIQEFLEGFQLNDKFFYKEKIQLIAKRQIKIFDFHLDHLLDFSKDPVLIKNIENNTTRYIKILTNILDDLVAKATATLGNTEFAHDIFDVIYQQRLSAIQAANSRNPSSNIEGESDSQVIKTGIPNALLRRYEIVILPLSSSVPKSIRELRSNDLGSLVTVTGLVSRISEVRPKIQVATYICQNCSSEIYQEIFSTEYESVKECTSKRCRGEKNKNKKNFVFQMKGSKFIKVQNIKLQELPNQVPQGQVPRNLLVLCQGETTRLVKPGEYIKLIGIFLPLKELGRNQWVSRGSGGASNFLITDTYLLASTIFSLNPFQMINTTGLTTNNITSKEEMWLKRLVQDPDPYSRLAYSIAPEIYGQIEVKKAILLQLVGGCEKKMKDGMKLRGNIHLLLVGDPGLAKSQLLRSSVSLAPKGALTTGKGTSGAGLTAALVKDQGMNGGGEPCLEAGALLLAHEGVCAIDEFDKMNEIDRSSIHEVMEQQTLSIAKAHFVTTLQAHTSILAAANPLYGRYNHRLSLAKNIDLPNSLLSRFDLVFILIDNINVETDTALAKHVLSVHQSHGLSHKKGSSSMASNVPYSSSYPLKSKDIESLENQNKKKNTKKLKKIKKILENNKNFNENKLKDLNIDTLESFDPDFDTLDSDFDSSDDDFASDDDDDEIDFNETIPVNIFKQYIYIAQTFNPVIPPELKEHIVETYVSQRETERLSDRNREYENNQAAMTARQLLSTLRLSQALARLRFSDKVSLEDVNEAIRLTYVSKSSLIEQNNKENLSSFSSSSSSYSSSGDDDILSKIFNLLRSISTQTRSNILDYSDVEARIARQGFPKNALETCLQNYSMLGVLYVDSDRTKITLDP